MAWLVKVRSAVSSLVSDAVVPCRRKKSVVGILAFEIAALMSKLIHLWRSLSDDRIARLRDDSIMLEGVRKVVSDDETFLLALACAELADTIRTTAESIAAVVAPRCVDQGLRDSHESFKEFARSASDSRRWVLSWKDMEVKVLKRMKKYITETAALYNEMEQLAEAEQSLRRLVAAGKLSTAEEAQQKVLWRKRRVHILKQSSLWNCSFDAAALLLARACFTTLSRLKQVFNLGTDHPPSPPLPRSVSFSAAVYPSPQQQQRFSSGPLEIESTNKQEKRCGVLEMSKLILIPPSSTLGAAALALQYTNVVIILEKMVRTPGAVGSNARDDLYTMLPATAKERLRERLKRVVRTPPSMDVVLAAEWKTAVGCIVGWLGPLAHNTIRWQAERSFDQRRRRTAATGNVLLVQTLVFADRDKVEDAITELLVGLNYLWRFEREVPATAAAQQRQQQQVEINRIQLNST